MSEIEKQIEQNADNAREICGIDVSAIPSKWLHWDVVEELPQAERASPTLAKPKTLESSSKWTTTPTRLECRVYDKFKIRFWPDFGIHRLESLDK
jgi:hypothetical protein